MTNYEVETPIINSPYLEPREHWWIAEGAPPERRAGRRPAMYWFKPPGSADESADLRHGTLIELKLVNRIRERVAAWRSEALRGGGGVTRTTCELLNYWRRDGRQQPLFFAQLEAAETIIFLTEARADFKQGIDVPLDDVSERQREDGLRAFRRYACKMATGSGKTTVMGMLAAWSILNKVAQRGDARFSDVVLVVCPNVTIRSRLAELDPQQAEASLYRRRDLVPAHLMAQLCQGRVLVTNWHVFEPHAVQTGGVSAKVSKAGRRVERVEWIHVGQKTTTARGSRYMTPQTIAALVVKGDLEILEEETDAQGRVVKVKTRAYDYVESDTALVQRVLGRDVGGKQNILVFNDEAHHAYRLASETDEASDDDAFGDPFGDDDELEEFVREATVWVEGLDRVHKLRGINFCVDLSATPYYLARVGKDTNRIFPWVVSDFSLTDAIESGLVKVPQLAVRDATGAEIPVYLNIWRWIMERLTPQERGGKRGTPKPEAILKWAHTPIAMLGSLWQEEAKLWQADPEKAGRWPVFILVCKNTKIAKVVYEWLAEDQAPVGVPSCGIDGFRNRDGRVVTLRADTKVVHETDSGNAKSDEDAWMRLCLDTVGKREWPVDRQGRPIYPDGFEQLAHKLGRPLDPPGRDVRCIVSVGMLTEGWDCNTVTHIIGLRPFMSQLLCEQVVGRGLRRASYEVGSDGLLREEIARVLGVPFEIVPFKESKKGEPREPEKRTHVHAVPGREALRIAFPRVEGYRQAIRNKIAMDWDAVGRLFLTDNIPAEVQMKASLPINQGRPSLTGPGRLDTVGLDEFRRSHRLQTLSFELARDLVKFYAATPECSVPVHALFVQMQGIVDMFLREKVDVPVSKQLIDVFLSPYYGWVLERLLAGVRGDPREGEVPELPVYERSRGPGSTAEVSFWTGKDVRPVLKSELNYVVADTKKWEQAAAYVLDTHPAVVAFVKNDHLGLAIPYLHNGQMHEYLPDFLVRVRGRVGETNLILETKGFDPQKEVKSAAARRWVAAVNADGKHGTWAYAVGKPDEIRATVQAVS